jgi:hypothetical protein
MVGATHEQRHGGRLLGVAIVVVVAGALQRQPPINSDIDKLDKVLPLKYESRVGSTFKDFITKTLVHVAEDRTVADATAATEAKPQCQDDEPMRGWILNVDIARISQA